jgi:hypothetical protein
MYFDRDYQIEVKLLKIELILHYTKNTGVLIAADCNARSTLWHDKLTKSRGRILEEFITSKRLFIMNEVSGNTTFGNRLGTSSIDLTIIKQPLLKSITRWEISDKESVSDHNIIKYKLKQGIAKWNFENYSHIRYRMSKDSMVSVQDALLQVLREKFTTNDITIRVEEADEMLSSLVTENANIEEIVFKFNESLKTACNNTFQIRRASRNLTSHRSVPWWSVDLTTMRKRTNALRRLYQRTRHNEVLREKRKTQYYESKVTYAATIERENIRSWKEFCEVSTATNP